MEFTAQRRSESSRSMVGSGDNAVKTHLFTRMRPTHSKAKTW